MCDTRIVGLTRRYKPLVFAFYDSNSPVKKQKVAVSVVAETKLSGKKCVDSMQAPATPCSSKTMTLKCQEQRAQKKVAVNDDGMASEQNSEPKLNGKQDVHKMHTIATPCSSKAVTLKCHEQRAKVSEGNDMCKVMHTRLVTNIVYSNSKMLF